MQTREIVLSVCEPKEYVGKEAHSLLNLISGKLNQAIANNCGNYEKTKLVQVFYALFDESIYRSLAGEHFRTHDLSIVRKLEKAPTVFGYLLEVTIQCSETQPIRDLTEEDLSSLVFSSGVFLEACSYSNYLYRNDFNGGFTVSKDGGISFRVNDQVQKSEESFIEKIGLLSEKIVSGTEKLEFVNNPKRASLREDALCYDSVFRKTYGLDLSSVVVTAESIVFDICNKAYGVVSISQNALLKKIMRKTSYDKGTVKKAIQYLQIGKDMLSENWQYYKFRDVPVSVSRRPIVRLFSGVGEKGDTVYFGPNALFRAIILLLSDIDRGIIQLGNVAERWAAEKGHEFEENVRLILSQHGFKVIRVTDPPPEVGEIDAVAFCEMKKILLVAEAKAPKIDLSMDKAKWHFERSREWCQTHDRKVKWARENAQTLVKRLGLSATSIEEIIGVIVTRVPWYVESNLPCMILSVEEFERFLNRI
jgi:Holliday junction resolvase-like predicted endonuclease